MDSRPFRIFFSYSHKDKRMLDDLLATLKPFIVGGILDEWSDKRIAPGKQWRKEIGEAIEQSDLAVLLVSKYFLGSDFINKAELPPILEREKSKGMKVSWIALAPTSVDGIRHMNSVAGTERLSVGVRN